MNYPNYPEKTQFEALFKAEDIIAYRRRLGRMPDIDSPRAVLFCLERGLPERLRWRIPVRRAGNMDGDVHETKKTKNKVVILTNFGSGATMLVELAEEFAVLGAKKMIVMSWAGALQPHLKPGNIVISSRSIRDDGVSQHYLPLEKYIDGDALLAEQLGQAIRARGAEYEQGTTWTTSAPFRETREEVMRYQAEAVKVVEMESAGLFTIGKLRGVKTASVVVVMDSLATLSWKAPEKLDGIFHSLELVYTAAIDVLAQD
ncbi:MAG: nucleoside phosphorylase [Chloroflexi bacterium]|nr:nucleoside phosphorylase [Chloroflexota bacterium]